MDPIEQQRSPVEQYLVTVAAKKITWALGKFLTAFFSSVAVTSFLYKYGIAVDPTVLIGALTTAILSALEWAHDYVRLKTGWRWL